jgi:ferric-chelate reductase
MIRFLRIGYHNTSFSSNRSNSLFDARAEAVTENFIRLTVRRPSQFQWKAGQTAYLMLPTVSAFPMESHPFTIASCDSAQTSKLGESTDTTLWKELVFFINVRNGMTKRLKQAVDEGRPINVLVEGPYGDAHDFNCFNTCTLIAGGTGISYTLPVFMDIIAYVLRFTTFYPYLSFFP